MTLALTPHSDARTIPGTLADQLVQALVRAGIDTFFGVPGGAIEPLFNALARAADNGLVTVLPTRSEAGAGFAADGYYRATGKLAVCTCTTGPGVSNLLTAVVNAHADRIPMLVITPQVALAKHGRGALQDSSPDGHDTTQLLKHGTVYSSTVSHPDQLGFKLLLALRRAVDAPRGPVHLAIPSDVLAASSGLPIEHAETALAPPRRVPDPALMRLLWRDLARARSPVFYVGDDAGPSARGLCSMAAALKARVITSPAGKRWVSHTDPAFAGVLGFSGHAGATEHLRNADLVVAFGATFDELSTNAWTLLPRATTYLVDAHAGFSHRVPHAHRVLGDVDAALEWLWRRTRGPVPAASSLRRLPLDRRLLQHHDADGPVHPSALMRWLAATLPAHVVVHADSGNSFSWSTRDLDRVKPDTYRVAMGFSSMAWAIGAAVGAAVGTQRRTLCITGDGAMLMSSLELSTAVQHQLPVTYVVLNDRGLGMVRHGQRLAGAASIAHDIAPVRFDKIAEACGATGIRIESFDQLAAIPKRYLASDAHGPCLIDVCIDREAVPPMAERVLGLAVGIPQ